MALKQGSNIFGPQATGLLFIRRHLEFEVGEMSVDLPRMKMKPIEFSKGGPAGKGKDAKGIGETQDSG